MRFILTLFALFSLLLAHGQNIKDFSLVNAVDQSTISLSSYKNARGIIVIFTSNNCPYSKLYENRILKLHERYSNQGWQVMLINPNNPEISPEDKMEKMKSKANKYSFPYLSDRDQKVTNIFGARKTPEAFLLKPKGATYDIIYRGSIDNNPQNDNDVSDPYLIKAIENLLENKQVLQDNSRPVGCMIKS